VGKTTITREYAEKFWRCYQQVFWVDCHNSMEAEFAGLLEVLLQKVGKEISSAVLQLRQPERAERVRLELNQADSGTSRLLILDNAQNEESVRDWIPRTGNCHTIITSRFANWSPGIDKYPI
jgi:hypothetical protein